MIAKNFPKLVKDGNLQSPKPQKIPCQIKNKKEKKNNEIYLEKGWYKMKTNFSYDTWEAKSQWNVIFKVLKKN